MAKAKTPPTAATPNSATALADPPRPQYREAPAYVVAPLDELDKKDALDSLREECRNASYSLLDIRAGKWCLMVFGGGQIMRHFDSLQEGIDFVRDLKIERCRCLQIEGGVIR